MMSEKNINRILTDALSGIDEDIINEVSEQRYASVKKTQKKKKKAALLLVAAVSCILIAGTSVLLMTKRDTSGPNVRITTSSISLTTETVITSKTVIYSQEKTIRYGESKFILSDSSVTIENKSGNLIFRNDEEMKTINDEKYIDALFYAVLDCSGSYLWKFYEAAGYIEKYGYDECVKLEQDTMLSYFDGIGVSIDEYGDHLYVGKFSYSAIKAITASKQFPDDMRITLLPEGYTLKDLLK